MSDLVTVLMPVYNAERFLEAALTSVLKQTHSALELLVVDDGSTDDSPRILERVAARDGRVRVLRQPNGGVSSALNLGIEAARGELIARMDADDVMLPRRLEVQSGFLRKNAAVGFCACYMDMIDGSDRVVSRFTPGPLSVEHLRRQIARRDVITYTHPTVMYRRSLAVELGGYIRAYEPCEDTEFFGRMLSKRHWGLVVPEVLMQYRMHAGSISARGARRQVDMLELVRQNFYRRLAGDSELSPCEYQAALKTVSLSKQLARRAKLEARALRQLAAYDRALGKPVRRGARLLCAAALQPHRALRWLVSA